MTAQQFPYQVRDARLGTASLAPILPLTLIASQKISALALVDSGAALNVLPYSVGLALGLNWDEHSIPLTLADNLATVGAKAVTISVIADSFEPVRMVFGWSQTDRSSVILGQINFFAEFDVCFFRSREIFEIRPKSSA